MTPPTIGKYIVGQIVEETELTTCISVTRKDLNQRMLMRLLRSELAALESVAARFRKEFKRTASLRSDHVVRIVDLGRTAPREHAVTQPYVVTEWIDGSSLASHMAAAHLPGQLSPVRAAELVAQACDAVGEVHQRGWIHAELTPSSMFVCHRSRGAPILKVQDFGLSSIRREIRRLDGGATPARVFGGQPLYLAPEQLDPSRKTDARADVWALGAILYHLLTGRAPFAADSIAEIFHRLAAGEVTPPLALRREVPEALDEVVMKCLQREPSRRYADARELLDALEEALADSSETSLVERSILPRLERAFMSSEESSETPARPFDAPPDLRTLVMQRAIHVPAAQPSAPTFGRRPDTTLVMVESPLHVGAPPVDGDGTSVIPSLVTSTDHSSHNLNVRAHPMPDLLPDVHRASPQERIVLPQSNGGIVAVLIGLVVVLLGVVALLLLRG